MSVAVHLESRLASPFLLEVRRRARGGLGVRVPLLGGVGTRSRNALARLRPERMGGINPRSGYPGDSRFREVPMAFKPLTPRQLEVPFACLGVGNRVAAHEGTPDTLGSLEGQDSRLFTLSASRS